MGSLLVKYPVTKGATQPGIVARVFEIPNKMELCRGAISRLFTIILQSLILVNPVAEERNEIEERAKSF